MLIPRISVVVNTEIRMESILLPRKRGKGCFDGVQLELGLLYSALAHGIKRSNRSKHRIRNRQDRKPRDCGYYPSRQTEILHNLRKALRFMARKKNLSKCEPWRQILFAFI